MFYKFLAIIAILSTVWACQKPKSLPYMGNRNTVQNGDKVDTIYQRISEFSFINQNGDSVTRKTVEGKVYVADFFFTTCPTICPKMKTQMLRIYERYKERDDVRILSYSIDPDFDNTSVLKDYAARLQVKAPKWNLLTGDKAAIYKLGQKSYMVSAQEDPNEAGGFVHSGAFILVDKNRHVRGIYDGTVEAEVNHLLEDMEILLNER